MLVRINIFLNINIKDKSFDFKPKKTTKKKIYIQQHLHQDKTWWLLKKYQTEIKKKLIKKNILLNLIKSDERPCHFDVDGY